ncbi:hypothetical protein [Dactylosporangium darangshiense]|uniref:DUF732 domain-containing protein n=1 Tax=Dactylosporangium darangshiense TaxID=579108 RepID=A0ABP8DM83_9ACTN
MNPDELPHGRLGELLRAAAAPGRPHELAGEVAAVAAFTRAYRPAKRLRRRIVATAVAVFTAASIGGTAFAAETGHLPAPIRSWFDSAPDPTTAAAAPSLPSGPRSVQPPGQATATTATGSPAAISPAAACRAFLASQADPHARKVTADERKELARLAGGSGEPVIEAYCQRLLGVTVTATKEPDKPKPSHPAHPSRK